MKPDDPKIEKLDKLIKKGRDVASTNKLYPGIAYAVDDVLFKRWVVEVELFFNKYVDKKDPIVVNFKKDISNSHPISRDDGLVNTGVQFLEVLKENLIESSDVDVPESSKIDKADPIKLIELICNKFPHLVSQLRKRYKNRKTLEITDEYDVQDLLRVLLSLFFDDIRTEEHTPSHAGSSSRMDFLLKEEDIAIETKITRDGNDEDRRIGKEISEDINWYKEHPHCSMLICFVYDPDRRINNRPGLIKDLEKTTDLRVRVFIHS